MQYMTIVLELLTERKELHERLRLTRQLLPTLGTCAKELKASHERWIDLLYETKPGSDPIQTSSEALEIAIKELEDRLPSVFPPDEEEALSLDQAMAFVLGPTPKK